MKPLKERNQAAVGLVALVLVSLAIVTAYRADEIPLLNDRTSYAAHFAESAGLAEGNDVQLAGVKVGEVDEVVLDGTHVRATFSLDGVDTSRIGDRTRASIEIKTLLGEKYLALRPEGESAQDPAEPIPVDRTDTPFELQDAFDRLSGTVEDIDTDRLAKSFDVVADTFADTPKPMTEALQGLSALSETVSSRDAQLGKLLSNTNKITGTLRSRNQQLRKVIGDGNSLLTELQNRRQDINQLLVGTRQVSRQLSGVVDDNREQLRPALQELSKVTTVLQRNQNNLDRSLELLAPFTRLGTNVTGNGRWFEGYICGMLPPTINTGTGYEYNSEGCIGDMAAPDQGVGGGR
ncbi:phospholipid/cholesterol/gamma-HCH transport system substrate-binding protein [Prauserella isguenensis]|uniref:Phospholipid/cholesterol/gamma-HCH transport system substrate-binding protein n=1 Tax=Prauserella isguenensis TaxID=1470180 RepID=A0A839S5M2_9PSEU|nr:phospholipid/cholesterol/gamma-HCH transport system substrate-binding protein [Prauserella isguenensis]